MTDLRITAARNLLVEATTTEVAGAFTEAGVSHVVLKGPVLRDRLFPGGDEHVSADVDVLVAPEHWAAAEIQLARLGFEPLLLDIIPGDRPNHARPYVRSTGGPSVDLHRTLLGAEAPASVVWSVLDGETEPAMLVGKPIRVLNPAGQLLHVALHAAQNGAGDARTLRYLTRCIEISDEQQAADALRIARAIEATDAFALGLSLVPVGAGAEPQVRDHAQRFGAHRAQSCIGPQHRPRRRMVRDAQDIPRPCALRRPQDLPAGRLHGELLPERPLARRPTARLPDTLAVARPPTASFAEGLEGSTTRPSTTTRRSSSE